MASSRDRFRVTMIHLSGDDPPLWEEGIREDVWEAWRGQGAGSEPGLRNRFRYDHREMVEVNLRAVPELPDGIAEGRYRRLRRCYQPGAEGRFPGNWDERARAWRQRDFAVGMVFTRGLFLSLAVGSWRTLEPLMYAMADCPREVAGGMVAACDLCYWAIEAVTACVDLDFAILSEPVASFRAPVVSPHYYRRFALPHYRRLVDRLKTAGVGVIVAQAFGQVGVLIPLWLDIGVNAFWCSHTVPAGMDYLRLRQDYGPTLRLIGGIDAQALTKGRADIDRAIDRTVPALLADGGYLPLLDDRVRPEVPYANYLYYREQLERAVQ